MGFTPQEEERIRKVMGLPEHTTLIGIKFPFADKVPNTATVTGIFPGKSVLNCNICIQAIYVTESIKRVVVVFKDGTKEIVDCGKDDNFDVNIGVALAISNHLFGTKTRFHKFVANEKVTKYIGERKTDKPVPKAPVKVDNRSKFKGTTWIHKSRKNKRIPINELDVYFSKGWEKGKYHKESK